MISRNIALLAFLYFLQGIPYGLQSRFLPLYFRTHGMSLSNIGYLKLLYFPWVSKALWAPLVDHYGTKKIWLSHSMLGLFVTCLLGSLTSPEYIPQLVILLFIFNFLTATQDIAVDGLAIHILATSELASGNIAQVVGYKFGAVLSGGFMTWLNDLGWGTLFFSLAAVYLTAYGIVVKTIHESKAHSVRQETSSNKKLLGSSKENEMKNKEEIIEDRRMNENEEHWIVKHVKMVLASKGTRWTLIYVLIYKLGEQGALTTMPLYLIDQGVSSSSVGLWTGFIGQGISIFGSFLGGWLVSWFWYTPYKILVAFSIVRPLILTVFACLIFVWPETETGNQFYLACTIVSFLVLLLGSGVVTTTTFTLMMFCSQRSPSTIQASHYTTMATIEVLGKLTFSVVVGLVTEMIGYFCSFLLFVVLAVFVLPVLIKCPKDLKDMNRNKR